MTSINELLTKLLIFFAVMLSPIHAVMASVGFLIMADFLTGIWAAFKRKEKLSSAGMRRTISKMIIYQIAIISAFFIEYHILGNSVPMTKIVAGFIALTELKSILENGNTILGVNIFKQLIAKLGSKNDQ